MPSHRTPELSTSLCNPLSFNTRKPIQTISSGGTEFHSAFRLTELPVVPNLSEGGRTTDYGLSTVILDLGPWTLDFGLTVLPC